MSVRLVASIRLHFVGPSAFLQEQQACCGQKVHRLLLALVSMLFPKTIAVPAAMLAMIRRRLLPVANPVVRWSKRCASISRAPCELHGVSHSQPVRPWVLLGQA